MNDKKCKICLLRDINPEEYQTKIKRIIDLMKEQEKASEQTYQLRLDECVSCHYLKDGFCMACGCYVELRAIKRDGNCPYDKWM